MGRGQGLGAGRAARREPGPGAADLAAQVAAVVGEGARDSSAAVAPTRAYSA